VVLDIPGLMTRFSG
jgi:hypothetical protein